MRVILLPANDELIPDGALLYTLPQLKKQVVDVIAPDDWKFQDTILYKEDSPGKVSIPLSEPLIHNFAGWGS